MSHGIYEYAMSHINNSCHVWIWIMSPIILYRHHANRRRSGQDPNSSLHAKLRKAQLGDPKVQRTATHCNTLQQTATHCTLQHAATHCHTLQYDSLYPKLWKAQLGDLTCHDSFWCEWHDSCIMWHDSFAAAYTPKNGNPPQHDFASRVAACCSMPQYAAVCCSILHLAIAELRVARLRDCVVWHSHARHDSASMHVCEMTHAKVHKGGSRHVFLISLTSDACLESAPHIRDFAYRLVCDRTHGHVWRDSSTYVTDTTWVSDMCGMTH